MKGWTGLERHGTSCCRVRTGSRFLRHVTSYFIVTDEGDERRNEKGRHKSRLNTLART